MSGNFSPIPLPQLLRITLKEIQNKQFMGIPGALFFRPGPGDKFKMTRYGQMLETPVGVAAGPHTQLALNIIAAWLCGARYIELKTVQTLDELEVSKPCIDMQDEGYNCEWSQELKIHESFHEYLNAWILIHILHKELGFAGDAGVIFNMSVGYNMEGILRENVQWFFSKMDDCSEELAEAIGSIRDIYPLVDKIAIPHRISNNITLSTMHGCPPEEIEKIGLYLIREKRLHTTIKLNPTLLGPDLLRSILNVELGFDTEVPDLAFDHDLKYPDALKILGSLESASRETGVDFSIKLTNTLESINKRDVFPPAEKMMYMSGRPLHPISVQVARKLQNDLNGQLDISFSAGVDCFNLPDILASGMRPVTVCSDLLKPGGYGRLAQYLAVLSHEMELVQADDLDGYILLRSGLPAFSGKDKQAQVKNAALVNLNGYADGVCTNPAFHKDPLSTPTIKTTRPLGWFDCIHAPCTDTCPTNQDIPEYMHHAAAGNLAAAYQTILRTNPFPSVTGMVCDHLCQMKCTRINYDESLLIREIKRYVAETSLPTPLPEGEGPGGRGYAVIGAGPAGLSCAWFLRQAGCEVHVFEQKEIPGGMVSAAIPEFRLTSSAIESDIQRILSSGIQLHDKYPIDQEKFKTIQKEFDAVFLAAGAQRSVKLKLDGIETPGVLDPLAFLYDVRSGNIHFSGKHVVIIGGGNTAMDAARTAYRLVGEHGSVTIVYRRTMKEMPADRGEIKAVVEEGVAIYEQTRPLRINTENGHVSSLVCCKTVLSVKGKDGRPVPVDVPDSEFEILCDTVIPAIGQEIALDFLSMEDLKIVKGNYGTATPKLYVGGDALRGASTAINAIGDGRKAAIEILGGPILPSSSDGPKNPLRSCDIDDLMVRKSTREFGISPAEVAVEKRRNFNLVMSSLTAEEAQKEASRCLQCDLICNVCVSVCPNLANFSFKVDEVKYQMQKAVLMDDGAIGFEQAGVFAVEQSVQVLNIRDLCNECGNCTTFCPSAGRPFSDKPGLCLSVKSLNAEDSGFFLSRLPDRMVLIYKEQNHVKTLSLQNDQYIYETDQVRAVIRKDDFGLIDVNFLTPCVREFHFTFAAEMSIILQGATQLL